jgi:hypothetical protein
MKGSFEMALPTPITTAAMLALLEALGTIAECGGCCVLDGGAFAIVKDKKKKTELLRGEHVYYVLMNNST